MLNLTLSVATEETGKF